MCKLFMMTLVDSGGFLQIICPFLFLINNRHYLSLKDSRNVVFTFWSSEGRQFTHAFWVIESSVFESRTRLDLGFP